MRQTRKALSPSPSLIFPLALALALALIPAQLMAAGSCTGVNAAVTLDSVSWSNNIVSASGSWDAWGGGADGIRLQHYVDNQLFGTEYQSGVWGDWDFDDNYSTLGVHEFKVKACPRVGSTTCEQHCTTKSQNFTVETTLSVSMSFGPPGECFGGYQFWFPVATASGGTGSFNFSWSVVSGGGVVEGDGPSANPNNATAYFSSSSQRVRVTVTSGTQSVSKELTHVNECGGGPEF